MPNHKPPYSLLIAPLALVIIGFVAYFIVDKATTPPVQTLTIEPVEPTASDSAEVSPIATPLSTPQSSSSAQ